MKDVLLRYKTVFKYLFWIWLILIIIFSSYPKMPFKGAIEMDGFYIRLDYIIHFSAYFILVLLYMFWLGVKDPDRKMLFFLLPVLGGFVISSLIEGIQLFIPGRMYNPIDIFYNCVGVAMGVIFFYLFIFRRITHSRQ